MVKKRWLIGLPAVTLAGVAALTLAVALGVEGCRVELAYDPLDGTWAENGVRLIFRNANWERRSNIPEKKGSYTVIGNIVVMAVSHHYQVSEGGWNTRSQLEQAWADYTGTPSLEELLDSFFEPLIGTVNGDSMEVEINGVPRVFRRQ